MRDVLLAIALFVAVGSCHSDAPPTQNAVADAGTCHANVGLMAWTTQTATSGVTVFGTTKAPDGVTVRAIYVAAEAVPLTAFNFRTWSVTLRTPDLVALARNGKAVIPIIAFTSAGCQTLTGSAEPFVQIDGGVAPDDGSSVRDATSHADATSKSDGAWRSDAAGDGHGG